MSPAGCGTDGGAQQSTFPSACAVVAPGLAKAMDVFLKPLAAHLSESPVGWPCRNTSPMEIKTFLAD